MEHRTQVKRSSRITRHLETMGWSNGTEVYGYEGALMYQQGASVRRNTANRNYFSINQFLPFGH